MDENIIGCLFEIGIWYICWNCLFEGNLVFLVEGMILVVNKICLVLVKVIGVLFFEKVVKWWGFLLFFDIINMFIFFMWLEVKVICLLLGF